MKLKSIFEATLASLTLLATFSPLIDTHPQIVYAEDAKDKKTRAEEKEKDNKDKKKEFIQGVKDAGYDGEFEELHDKVDFDKFKTKEESIPWYMSYIFTNGNYIEDVSHYSHGIYDNELPVDKNAIQEINGKQSVCYFNDTPQNVLNHNCDVPAFMTELFQNVTSIWETTGVIGAQTTSSKAALGLGIPLGIEEVPVDPNARTKRYSALELYGYDLKYTQYLGEWDHIQVSTDARLMSNVGFWGKVKIGGDGIWKGVTNVLNKFWNAWTFDISKWGLNQPGFADGVVSTVIDTSDANVIITRSWNRPNFAATLYNGYYMTDKEVVEKAQEEFLKYFQTKLFEKSEEYPEIQELLKLLPERETFPKFKYDPNLYTESSKAALAAWKECDFQRQTSTTTTKIDCGTEPKLEVVPEEEQYQNWINSPDVLPTRTLAESKSIGCFADSKIEKEFLECYSKEFEKYAKKEMNANGLVMNTIMKDLENDFFKDNPHLDPKQPISHYICADEYGNPIGGDDKKDWKYLYEKYNSLTEEFITPGCNKIRPSIKGAKYGNGEFKTKSQRTTDDDRYNVYSTQKVSRSNYSASSLAYSITKAATQITNTFLSLSFSNFIEFLEIDKMIETTVKTFTESLFFPLSVLSSALWGIWILLKASRNGYAFGFKEIFTGIFIWMIGFAFVLNIGKVVKLVEVVPNEIDKAMAKVILLNDKHDTACFTTGENAEVRNIQCSIWQLNILNPWIRGQFGANSIEDLNASAMGNRNGDIVGNASVNMGGGHISNNWALYQLDLTKTGTITSDDLDNPTGHTDKNIYRLVDLQAGPKNSKDSDKRFFNEWIGANPARRDFIRITSAFSSVFIMLSVVAIALAKAELTIEMAMKLFFLPFMVILSIFPNGRGKLTQYVSDLIGIFIKRIFAVFILLVALNILKAISASPGSDIGIAFALIGMSVALKIYWKELVNIINSTSVDLDGIKNRYKSFEKALPRDLRLAVNKQINKVTDGVPGAIGGGIAGSIEGFKNYKSGYKSVKNPILHGITQGYNNSVMRSDKMDENKQRRLGFGMITRMKQASDAGKESIKRDFEKPSKKFMTKVNTLHSTLLEESIKLQKLSNELETRYSELQKDPNASQDEIREIKSQLDELNGDKFKGIVGRKQKVDNALTRLNGIVNSDSKNEIDEEWTPDENKLVNKALYDLKLESFSKFSFDEKSGLIKQETVKDTADDFIEKIYMIETNEGKYDEYIPEKVIEKQRKEDRIKAGKDKYKDPDDTTPNDDVSEEIIIDETTGEPIRKQIIEETTIKKGGKYSKQVSQIKKQGLSSKLKTDYQIDEFLYYDQFNKYAKSFGPNANPREIIEFAFKGMEETAQVKIIKNYLIENYVNVKSNGMTKDFASEKNQKPIPRHYLGLSPKDPYYAEKLIEESLIAAGKIDRISIPKPDKSDYTITGSKIRKTDEDIVKYREIRTETKPEKPVTEREYTATPVSKLPEKLEIKQPEKPNEPIKFKEPTEKTPLGKGKNVKATLIEPLDTLKPKLGIKEELGIVTQIWANEELTSSATGFVAAYMATGQAEVFTTETVTEVAQDVKNTEEKVVDKVVTQVVDVKPVKDLINRAALKIIDKPAQLELEKTPDYKLLTAEQKLERLEEIKSLKQLELTENDYLDALNKEIEIERSIQNKLNKKDDILDTPKNIKAKIESELESKIFDTKESIRGIKDQIIYSGINPIIDKVADPIVEKSNEATEQLKEIGIKTKDKVTDNIDKAIEKVENKLVENNLIKSKPIKNKAKPTKKPKGLINTAAIVNPFKKNKKLPNVTKLETILPELDKKGNPKKLSKLDSKFNDALSELNGKENKQYKSYIDSQLEVLQKQGTSKKQILDRMNELNEATKYATDLNKKKAKNGKGKK